jgi:hypothetical protein
VPVTPFTEHAEPIVGVTVVEVVAVAGAVVVVVVIHTMFTPE